jgi:hypothetical protein
MAKKGIRGDVRKLIEEDHPLHTTHTRPKTPTKLRKHREHLSL